MSRVPGAPVREVRLAHAEPVDVHASESDGSRLPLDETATLEKRALRLLAVTPRT